MCDMQPFLLFLLSYDFFYFESTKTPKRHQKPKRERDAKHQGGGGETHTKSISSWRVAMAELTIRQQTQPMKRHRSRTAELISQKVYM